MERLEEFCKLGKFPISGNKIDNKAFYYEIYNEIKNIERKALRTKNQRGILLIDAELEEFVKKSTAILDSVDIKGSSDVLSHFEGVKYILKKNMVLLSKRLVELKKSHINSEISLVPEKAQDTVKVDQSLTYELENRRILETTQYEETRQRLMKIDVVQKAIQQNLILQDERIDSICVEQESTSNIYSELIGDDQFSTGSFTRRATATIIQCMTFVLIFLHLFYKK